MYMIIGNDDFPWQGEFKVMFIVRTIEEAKEHRGYARMLCETDDERIKVGMTELELEDKAFRYIGWEENKERFSSYHQST